LRNDERRPQHERLRNDEHRPDIEERLKDAELGLI
jgi:hypothetical protein